MCFRIYVGNVSLQDGACAFVSINPSHAINTNMLQLNVPRDTEQKKIDHCRLC